MWIFNREVKMPCVYSSNPLFYIILFWFVDITNRTNRQAKNNKPRSFDPGNIKYTMQMKSIQWNRKCNIQIRNFTMHKETYTIPIKIIQSQLSNKTLFYMLYLVAIKFLTGRSTFLGVGRLIYQVGHHDIDQLRAFISKRWSPITPWITFVFHRSIIGRRLDNILWIWRQSSTIKRSVADKYVYRHA